MLEKLRLSRGGDAILQQGENIVTGALGIDAVIGESCSPLVIKQVLRNDVRTAEDPAARKLDNREAEEEEGCGDRFVSE